MRRSLFRFIWDTVSPFSPAADVRMMSKHPQRVIAFARGLIQDRRRWTTGVEMRGANGYETSHTDEAVAFCAAGAIRACAHTEQACNAALESLAKVVRERHSFPDWWTPFMVISRVSDQHGHKEILEAFDETLRRG